MKIPIVFEYQGKKFEGTLNMVSGGGSNSNFYLLIDNFYYGQLFYSSYGWQFESTKDHFKGMGEFFGQYVSHWIDSNQMLL